MRRLVAVAVLAVALASCSSAEPSPEEQAKEQSSLACDHFRNIAGDVTAGVLNNTELRNKLKEVYDNSIIATPAVREAARKMLAAITADDSDALGVGVREMDAACKAAGH